MCSICCRHRFSFTSFRRRRRRRVFVFIPFTYQRPPPRSASLPPLKIASHQFLTYHHSSLCICHNHFTCTLGPCIFIHCLFLPEVWNCFLLIVLMLLLLLLLVLSVFVQNFVFLYLHFFPTHQQENRRRTSGREKSMYECVNYVRIKSAYIYKECTQQPHSNTHNGAYTQFRIIFGWNVCTSGVKKQRERCVNKVKTKLTGKKNKRIQTCTHQWERYLWRIEKWITRGPHKKRKCETKSNEAKRIPVPQTEHDG